MAFINWPESLGKKQLMSCGCTRTIEEVLDVQTDKRAA